MKNSPNRYATLLRFRKDASPAEIAKALNSIKAILEPEDVPNKWSEKVHHYDDRWGEPTFYIP